MLSVHGVEPDVVCFSAAISTNPNPNPNPNPSPNPSPNQVCFSAAISACEKVEDWELAAKLLGRLRATGLPPDAIVYNVSILLHSRREEWQQAIEMLREMARSGFEVRAVGAPGRARQRVGAGREGRRIGRGGAALAPCLTDHLSQNPPLRAARAAGP